MKAVALQSTSESSPARKQQKPVAQPASVLQGFPGIDAVNEGVIQRKPGCACGGGCPRCAGESHPFNIQTKLSISTPGDPYEQEADQVAEKVMRMAIPSRPSQSTPPAVQRKCGVCEGGTGTCPKCVEENETVQREPVFSGITPYVQRQLSTLDGGEKREHLQTKGGGAGARSVQSEASQKAKPVEPVEEEEEQEANMEVQLEPLASNPDGPPEEDEDAHDRKLDSSLESRLSSSRGGGESLPEDVRTDMESAIGADFSGVKVHTDQSAIQMNQDLGAKAFTHRNNIYFNSSSYNPSARAGRKLLAHELTHVVQQSGGRQKAPVQNGTEKIKQVSKKDTLQLIPNVTNLTASAAEIPAGQGSRVTFRATAAPGTVLNWNFGGAAALGAVTGAGTGRTNTLTAPAGSTGGVVTVQVADAANGADVFPAAPMNITLVEIQQPTFALTPVPAVIAPAGAAFPANTVEASVCGNNATAAAVRVPVRPVTWSIVGNRRGAVIDPATGVITPSVTETGNIVVRATDNALPAARNQQTLTVRARPTRITNTIRTGLVSALAGFGPYGSVYDHIFQSSGGALTGVNVSERVFCGNDPFNICPGFLPVLPGPPNIWTLNAARRMIGDLMATPNTAPGIDVNRFLPSPPNPGLPQDLTSPQILYWRSEQCGQWIPFQNVPIHFILRRRTAGGFETVTINNGVAGPPERYTTPPAPALAAPAAPVASACAAGEGISNVTFNPNPIAADGSALTTTAATARVRPGGNLVTWTVPPPNLTGAAVVAQGNPALISTGTIAGRVRVRVAMTATPACFAEGWLRMQEVVTGPAIRFTPATVRAGGTTRARVSTSPGPRIVVWTIVAPALGAVIAGNPDNSATITAGAQIGRITIRATDGRDATTFAEASLVIV